MNQHAPLPRSERRGPAVSGRAQALCEFGEAGQTNEALAPSIALGADLGIPPPPVAEAVDDAPMRPPAALTSSTGPSEVDRGRELRPVDWVEEAMLRADRQRGQPVLPVTSA